MTAGLTGKLIAAVMIIYSIGLAAYLTANPDEYQWDFRVYYHAAAAYSDGLNPYDANDVSSLSPIPIYLNFVYPPLALLLFRPLTIFEYDTAQTLFLIIKTIVLICILLLWNKYFLGKGKRILFYLICLFGFNSTIAGDLIAGNVSVFEQFILWSSFAFLLRRNYWIPMLLILIASIIKIAPVIYLALIPLVGGKDKIKIMIIGVAALTLIMVLSYIGNQELFAAFIGNAANLDERGLVNPSLYALLGDPGKWLLKHRGFEISPLLALGVYLAGTVIISGISWKSYVKLKKISNSDKHKMVIYLFCIVSALVMPRFKAYSYILLIVPAYYIMTEYADRLKAVPVLVIALLLTIPSKWNLPGTGLLIRAIWEYYPLILASVLWIMYLMHIEILAKRELTLPSN